MNNKKLKTRKHIKKLKKKKTKSVFKKNYCSLKNSKNDNLIISGRVPTIDTIFIFFLFIFIFDKKMYLDLLDHIFH